IPDTHGPLPLEPDPSFGAPQTLSVLSDLRPLGQLHDSFIIAAGRDGLWIIDQHVAHERILFEQVLRQQAEGRVEKQQLLMPLVLSITAAQQIEYARIADELDRSGFETEPFGNRTIAVKAAPAGIALADVEKLVFEILETAERELRRASYEDLRRSLDQTKMEWLLSNLSSTDCPMACPHGRPIALRYSMHDILKSFHRI